MKLIRSSGKTAVLPKRELNIRNLRFGSEARGVGFDPNKRQTVLIGDHIKLNSPCTLYTNRYSCIRLQAGYVVIKRVFINVPPVVGNDFAERSACLCEYTSASLQWRTRDDGGKTFDEVKRG